ncbi:protein-cysteine N-palmitoyltransferase HHAT-like [Argiope bruennichi]|uniref:protein-cysteine N-palmitoyltransferase HHAT-like n=1 Tax=Argiope bruennichi TaxID=94029 RepID=UPI002494ED27|nr:protein-cysteine N-palmitoyltransferase HHAT-like [Argiope bruennichi]
MERAFHWSIWSASIFYSLYKFKKSCEYHPRLSPHDFTKGWNVFSLEHIMKDNSDLEWLILTSTFKKFYMILLFQVVCIQIILRINKFIILVFYSIFSLMCLTIIMGCPAVLLFVLYPALMFIVHRIGRKLVCYFLTICTLLLVHQPSFHIVKESLALKDSESFLFDVALAWLTIKSLSFAIDRIDAKIYGSWTSSDIFSILAYCFYLPVFFTGPVMNYETFCEMHKTSHPIPLKEFSLHFLHLLFCRISWYFVYELLLLFIYSSSVQFYPEEVTNYDSWALCGLGYALPMMFFLKYYVIYGTANGIGKLEGFELPPPPKCISCIHLSSFLWRHFDRGLYLWILKYLYYPVINSQWNILRKLLALCICFGFVCIWHGMDKSVCLSTTINCLLVSSEIVVKFILTTRNGKSFEKLSSAMKTRISAAVSTPHFLMMCLSCCFFLSNYDIGMLLVKRIFSGDLYPLGPLLIIMYCGCHVSMDSKAVIKTM